MWVINHGRLTLYLPSKFKPILNMLRPWIFDFKPIWSEKTWFLLQSPPNDVIFKPNRKWYENATKNVAVSIKLSKLCRKPQVHIIFRSEEEREQTNFGKKKNLILLIYIGGTKLQLKIEIFCIFWLENLRDRWKIGGKVRISIWKEISSGFQKWHQIFDTLIRSLDIP